MTENIMNKIIEIKEKYNNVFNKIYEAGGKIFLVGGSVRDLYLNRKSNDIDFCITGITPEIFISLFPEAEMTGESFPVFRLDNVEFAFARKEKKIGKGHNGFEVNINVDITIFEDIFRRDITINSMAINMKSLELIDLFNGLQDIQNKIIRFIDKRAFKEDALRVYRVARFAASLNFEVSEETIKLMNEMKESLYELSSERVYGEMYKALKTDNPEKFFNVLKEANILSVHFPEIFNLINKKSHTLHTNVYEHSIDALREAVKLTESVSIRYAVLLHDIGKGILEIPYHKHDKEGVGLIKVFSRRLKTPMKMQKMAELVSLYHMKALRYNEMRTSKKLKFLFGIKDNIDAIVIMIEIDCNLCNLCNIPLGFNPDIFKVDLNIFEQITGKDIINKYPNVKGKAFGEMLFQERISYYNKEVN